MKKDTFTESGPLCPRCGIRYNECDCYVAEMHPENYPNPPQSQPEVQQGESQINARCEECGYQYFESPIISTSGETKAPQMRCPECGALDSIWINPPKKDKPSLKSQLEALVGELEGKIPAHAEHPEEQERKLAYGHCVLRLRELLKGLE